MFIKIISFIFIFSLSLNAIEITKEECNNKEDNYIYSGGECINFITYEGEDNEDIIVLVHGTWKEGTNILGRYNTFAENINMNTDKTVIAIALPGYSGSSMNNLLSIDNKLYKHQATNIEYVDFLKSLMISLKEKYEAKNITFLGHSAGAKLGAVLAGKEPNLFKNVILVGGRYIRNEKDKKEVLMPSDLLLNNNENKTNFIFVYGTIDKISPPKNTIDFVKKLSSYNKKTQIFKSVNSPHLDLEMTETTMETINSLFE